MKYLPLIIAMVIIAMVIVTTTMFWPDIVTIGNLLGIIAGTSLLVFFAFRS